MDKLHVFMTFDQWCSENQRRMIWVKGLTVFNTPKVFGPLVSYSEDTGIAIDTKGATSKLKFSKGRTAMFEQVINRICCAVIN